MLNPMIKQALELTDVYKKYQDAPLPIREAMCYKAQYPALLPDIRQGDIYAGHRTDRRIVYVGSVMWYGMPTCTAENIVEGKQGGYCYDFKAQYDLPQNDEERAAFNELTDFWMKECTSSKVYATAEIQEGVGFLFANNLDRLVKRGLPGLVNDVSVMPESDLRTGMLSVLTTVVDVCRHYQQQAEAKGFCDIAKNISGIINHAPQTLYEALQLILIYELLSHEKHYELNRLDVALGDLYVQEIDNGTLTEEQAVNLIHAFFKMIRENGEVAVCRLIMGGLHRRNEHNADRFIKAALIATQRHRDVVPQVTLRIHKGTCPKIMKLAYETINETGTFPTLFNDDAIIDGVATAYNVSPEDAKKYYPLGCGEIILAPGSPALLCTAWAIPQTVNDGIRAGNAASFDELYENVLVQIKRKAEVYARYHKLLADTNSGDCAFLMGSLLTDDCITRAKPMLAGGAQFIGACVMGHGFTNGADSLVAIKRLVYDQKKYNLAEIIQALDANFAGYEDLHKALIAAPKYGNDEAEVDHMTARLWRDISDAASKAGKDYGLDFHTVSSVNPGGYHLGAVTEATADGRYKNTSFAIGNAPTAGADKNGLTALMNSVLKTDPANGGTMTNFKVSREFFTNERGKFEALFAAYWANGGLQANITIVNKGELEAALRQPENYPHVLVRLGGWTARFVDLERHIQEEILTRTLY